MLETRRDQLLLTQAAWMGAAFAVLVVLGRFLVETYFVVCFVGLLVAMQLYAPTEKPPSWWLPLRLFVVFCFGVLAYLMYLRFAAVG